jgi:hypothetical protein
VRSLVEEAECLDPLSADARTRPRLLLASLLVVGLGACQGASVEGESTDSDPTFEIANRSPGVIGLLALPDFVVADTEGEIRQSPSGAVELEPGARVVYRATDAAAVSAERELVFELYSLSSAGHRGTRLLQLRGTLPWRVEVVGEGLRLAFYPSGCELDVLDVREVMPAGEIRPR